jgi:hypothetical protein
MAAPFPTQLDFKEIRNTRQRDTNAAICQSILSGVIPLSLINENELNRVLEETGRSSEQLLSECQQNELATIILSGRIAKKSSRQGTRDEQLQLQTCHNTTTLCGVNIENLSVFAFRPTKTGEILSDSEIRTRGIPKNECLKSFDGRITGRMNGWIFAKVVYGSGGHQDNVFEEADTICNWVSRFRESHHNDLFVILIDTDLQRKYETLKTKYSGVNGLLIMNHVEFQQYVIANEIA